MLFLKIHSPILQNNNFFFFAEFHDHLELGLWFSDSRSLKLKYIVGDVGKF